MKVREIDNKILYSRVDKLRRGFRKLRKKNFTYTFGFTLMECANVGNIALQMFLTDFYLQKKFFNYGEYFFGYVPIFGRGGANFAWSQMDTIFPRVASCDFEDYGITGYVQVRQKLSILTR